MENPIVKLKENISSLTNTQRQVANYIIEHPVDVAFLTVDQLAGKVGTSTTTIMRLAFSLGYSGYSEFQKGLQQNLRSQASPGTRFEVNLKGNTDENLWISNVNHQLENIQQTVDLISNETLDSVINMIMKSKMIYCSSVRSGMPVSYHLTHGLNRLLGNCKMLPADRIEWVDDMISLNSEDLIIAISYPRYSSRLLEFVKHARERKAKVIVITNSYSSPFVKYADIVLPCPSGSLSFHNSIVSSILVADYIINAVAINFPERTKERLSELNEVLTSLDYHVL
ncbi:MurR/RpiR family transcriptional regulator [Oceanobacillus sp. FSL W7-1304]|uniref:MurR/RpiR family transcriptional regulator n=1 Tax=Oceanobacillus sp. FSL W7-1304 TaxID=2975322 RepID=UPI0030DC9ED8